MALAIKDNKKIELDTYYRGKRIYVYHKDYGNCGKLDYYGPDSPWGVWLANINSRGDFRTQNFPNKEDAIEWLIATRREFVEACQLQQKMQKVGKQTTKQGV